MILEADRPRRRRGQELEDAILDAAWAQLAENGYAGFTIEAVAERAETSRPVIYRRFTDRADLAGAAIKHAMNRVPRDDPPDTGSLRGDLLAYLARANDHRGEIGSLLVAVISAYHAETGRSFAELREEAFGERAGRSMDMLFDRAVARGEADPARLTPRVRAVAFDLFRHDLMMTMAPLTEEAMAAIVDEVVLPLVTPRATTD
ncbi:TetR/AcrR family transcriptional regulator [Gordonia sp. CPCC 205515]|uniref:TetR/AcrR family transcriptional regulator n=1 Tax=Gordonia sp. CPCC 205515 TaxID=3140791 RepID=UPI003AF3FD12